MGPGLPGLPILLRGGHRRRRGPRPAFAAGRERGRARAAPARGRGRGGGRTRIVREPPVPLRTGGWPTRAARPPRRRPAPGRRRARRARKAMAASPRSPWMAAMSFRARTFFASRARTVRISRVAVLEAALGTVEPGQADAGPERVGAVRERLQEALHERKGLARRPDAHETFLGGGVARVEAQRQGVGLERQGQARRTLEQSAALHQVFRGRGGPEARPGLDRSGPRRPRAAPGDSLRTCSASMARAARSSRIGRSSVWRGALPGEGRQASGPEDEQGAQRARAA